MANKKDRCMNCGLELSLHNREDGCPGLSTKYKRYSGSTEERFDKLEARVKSLEEALAGGRLKRIEKVTRGFEIVGGAKNDGRG